MAVSTLTEQVARQALRAKAASRVLAQLLPVQKKRALEAMATALERGSSDILFHNEIDVEAARESDLSSAMVERLLLTAPSIKAMADGVREIANQPDPVGEILETWSRPSGIQIQKVRVPLGVIGMIYESRPNVTVDAAALSLKAGNAVILALSILAFAMGPLGAEDAKAPAPVAKIGSTILTENDLHKDQGMTVFDAENQLYEIKKNWVDSKAKPILFNQAAKDAGLSFQAWQAKEIDGKAAPLSEQELDQMTPRFAVRGSTVPPTDAQYAAMKKQAREYLIQQKRAQRENEVYQQLVQKYPIEMFFTKPEAPHINVTYAADDPIKGAKSAPVTIIEFTDFQCPYCKRSQDTLHQVEQVYGSKVALVERQYPLPFHNRAKPAAEAALCAKDQGKFWEMHDKLFPSQSLEDADIKRFATEVGLNQKKFDQCLAEHKYGPRIEADIADGQRYGVRGTPHFFINGRPISGAQPFEAFKSAIDEELAKKKG